MKSIHEVVNNSIHSSNKIIMMAHKRIDLDGLGSSLGLLAYCLDNEKDAYIFVNPNEFNCSVLKSVEMLPMDIQNRFLFNLDAVKIDNKSLLIVVDTNKEKLVESIDVFDKFKNTIVLDHHEKSEESLKSSINYVDSNASSMVEIVCDFLKSINYEIDNEVISTIMYTGMCIDTNNFNNNTRSNTMMCAAYLLENGASINKKRNLFQEKKEDILNRQRLLKRSTTIDENTMICVLDSNIYTADELAKISNALLKFDQIDTGYTIGKIATNTIGISARCFEGENVEVIMNVLGGGGHKTAAACALDKVSLQKAKDILLGVITTEEELDINKIKKK